MTTLTDYSDQTTVRPESSPARGVLRVAEDVFCLPVVMVNVYFVGPRSAGPGEWVLVDAGLPISAGRIERAAAELFGRDVPPGAIVLTHGHFDHVGSLHTLAEKWDVPIYAHALELPYLKGQSSYPPADPTVGGGLMARTSMIYPKGPYDFGDRVRPLPADGSVPWLPQWRWIHTPGHSPGHVSFFRDVDRVLIAGDAITTQEQESLIGVVTRHQELHGPPMYFTPDWERARQSVEIITDLQPSVAATGHGIPMSGPRLRRDLANLLMHFEDEAKPRHGRYVDEPAVADESGVVYVPPRPFDAVTTAVVGGIAAIALTAFFRSRK